MDLQFKELLDFCREPMLALEGNTISYLNASALSLFPTFAPGQSAVGKLPDYLLFDLSEQSVSSAMLYGREYTVSALRCGEVRLFSFLPAHTQNRSVLSDGLLGAMNAALFNIGLSARQLEKNSGESGAELRRYFGLLQHNYHLLARQLNDLSLSIRLQEQSVALQLRRCDLAELCRDLAASVNSLGRGELAAVEFVCELPALHGCVDRELVRRMLLQLLSNSFGHCTAESKITLRLERKAGRAVISVDDNGSGIPGHVMQNIFSRYESRPDPEMLTEYPGSGLGLGIARGIASLHGGTLIIESKPGRGTSVRVMLPLEQAGADLLEDSRDVLTGPSLTLLLTELADVLTADRYENLFDE